MKTTEELLLAINGLPGTERDSVLQSLDKLLIEATASVTSIQNVIFTEQAPCCPSCKSTHSRRNGKEHGVQRHICKDCGKSYRPNSGTLTAWLKKPELLKNYARHMFEGHSIKKCAELTGIAYQTAFDWRHKILAGLAKQQEHTVLSGICESDDVFITYSEKGNKHLTRKPRKRGKGIFEPKKQGISDEKVAVLISTDRKGNKHLQAVTRGRVSKKNIDSALKGRIAKGSVLCTDSHRSYSAFAKGEGLEHQKIKVSAKEYKRGIYHVQHVNQQAKALKEWLGDFNGVSSRYLQNYLNWFALKEKISQAALPAITAITLTLHSFDCCKVMLNIQLNNIY